MTASPPLLAPEATARARAPLASAATLPPQAYRDPDSETMSTWGLSFVASICAIVSVGKLDAVLLAYPLYLFALNGAIVAAILLGRQPQTCLPCYRRTFQRCSA